MEDSIFMQHLQVTVVRFPRTSWNLVSQGFRALACLLLLTCSLLTIFLEAGSICSSSVGTSESPAVVLLIN